MIRKWGAGIVIKKDKISDQRYNKHFVEKNEANRLKLQFLNYCTIKGTKNTQDEVSGT